MPHRFKRSQVSRSRGPPCSSRCSYPHYPHPAAASQPSPMAFSTPQSNRRHVYRFRQRDVRQANEQDMEAWRSELDGKIVSINGSMDDFLHVFVPGDVKPPPLKARQPFKVPVGKDESHMSEPLCSGLAKLVVDFPPERRLCFHNNAHEIIDFPFEKYQTNHHATKPDVVASLPGQTFSGRFRDRWRNISIVFEAKSTEKAVPKQYRSQENDEALVQLAKSARNILVAQSRLFVFVIGVYGGDARIYRFDHAGAVCSPAFKYSEKGGAVLHEFLWRLVNPLHEGCDIVGADPTVQLPTRDDREELEAALHAGGVQYDEHVWKMCRWVTVRGAGGMYDFRYLLYDLVFINPGLFSRATTVWSALEVDSQGQPTGVRMDEDGRPAGVQVIIKDSWQQLARRPETEHYEQIFAHIGSQVLRSHLEADARDDEVETEALLKAWDEGWTGLAQFVAGDDLGAEELIKTDPARVGQQTCSSKYLWDDLIQFYERSHTRTVSKSVGTPLSDFRRTKEMVGALRDAIQGHRTAFEAGILHRDISEGNVLMANGRGFLHDLDYASNWKALLYVRGYLHTIESWERFVQTGKGIPREGAVPTPDTERPIPVRDDGSANIRRLPPAPVVNRKGEKEYYVEAIVAERRVGRRAKEYLVKWTGYGADEMSWEEARNLRNGAALMDWLKRPEDERAELSKTYLDQGSGELKGKVTSAESEHEHDAAPVRAERNRTECKERTGTFYFMAIEVLRQEPRVIHQVRHDLESFFWLLVWLVLRHTDHTADKIKLLKSLFDQATAADCAAHKFHWLWAGSLAVKGNEPLTNLISDFQSLCRICHIKEIYAPLTHERVLDVFDKALARQDWPVSDRAIPFSLDSNPDLRHEARPQGSIPQGQLSGQGQRSASIRAGTYVSAAPLHVANLPRNQDVASERARRADNAAGILRNHVRSHSEAFQDVLRAASGSNPVDDPVVLDRGERSRRTSHSSLREIAVVLPHRLPDSPTLLARRRSTVNSGSMMPSPSPERGQAGSSSGSDQWSPVPSVNSRLYAASSEPDSDPDHPTTTDYGRESSPIRSSSPEMTSGPSVPKTGRKRSNQDLGQDEEEPGPSKRSKTRSQPRPQPSTSRPRTQPSTSRPRVRRS